MSQFGNTHSKKRKVHNNELFEITHPLNKKKYASFLHVVEQVYSVRACYKTLVKENHIIIKNK